MRYIVDSNEDWIQVSNPVQVLVMQHCPFDLGQRIRHKESGKLGVFGFHNDHPAVKWDGDSFFGGIMISEWEPYHAIHS